MAKFRQVYVDFWTDPRVLEEMTPEDRYFYLYLLTNPLTTQCGIYQITKKQMAFELGHSMESINSLVDRFENHHQLIKYNPETREIAIIKWGKYNLIKGGKPILDCVNAELESVKDKSLIQILAPHIANKAIAELFLRYVDDTSNDTPTIRPRNEGNNNKNNNKNNNIKDSCQKNKFSDEQMALANELLDLIHDHLPNFKQPNLKKWANDIRLMMERDKRSYEQIDFLIRWSQKNSFWRTNILSPAKLREQFDKLVARVYEEREKAKQEKIRSPGDYLSRKTEREQQEKEKVLRRYAAHDSGPGD